MATVPGYLDRIPIVAMLFRREMEAYVARHGEPADFSKGWWLPPVSAEQVWQSETAQIRSALGLHSIISITDHDSIHAPLELRTTLPTQDVPLSFEWTVPFNRGFFHLGVHNMRSAGCFERLSGFTQRPIQKDLPDLLEELHACPETLIVFNHPFWDLADVGPADHSASLRAFLAEHRERVHALELNGYRSSRENDAVASFARTWRLPLVSGGDRHGRAPNSLLNLTRAAWFAEFAREIREDRRSDILVMPEYEAPLAARKLAAAADVLRPNPSCPLGRSNWMDRVIYERHGVTERLSAHWPDGGPLWVRSALRIFQVLTSSPVRPLVRATFAVTGRRAENAGASHARMDQPSLRMTATRGRCSGDSASRPPRVAFFSDSYAEANGVARLSRSMADYAALHGLPFLCVHGGSATRLTTEGERARLELRRSPAALYLDHDLTFDFLFWRHAARVEQVLRTFKPDVLHVTGPSDAGLLGAHLGHRLRIPIVGSWHTNLHQYAALRWISWFSRWSKSDHPRAQRWIERNVLRLVLLFYRIPRTLMAPNEELVALLAERTKKPTYVMKHGVDTALFTPSKRTRNDDGLRIGFVGRLSPEKQVYRLVAVEQALQSTGRADIRLVIIGDGTELPRLRRHLPTAIFPGVLRGEALAQAYANLDLFVFPSESETFGLAVLEAMASGVPVIAMARGGPAFVIERGVSGCLAQDERELIDITRALVSDQARRQALGVAARARALSWSWDRAFDDLYGVYQRAWLADTSRSHPAFVGLETASGQEPR